MGNKKSSFFGKLFGGEFNYNKTPVHSAVSTTTDNIANTLSDLCIDPGLVASLNIKSTTSTPTISYDSSSKTLSISGRSIPERSQGFWIPVSNSLKKLPHNGLNKIIFSLEYFNTSSSKSIKDFLEINHFDKDSIAIVWRYENGDEDMLEAGEDFESILFDSKYKDSKYPHIKSFVFEQIEE